MKIRIKNQQSKITIHRKRLARLAKQVLKLKGVNKAELGILFVGKKRIQTLNKKFRKVDRPTDVLSFGMRQGKKEVPRLKEIIYPQILGDIVICPEMAEGSARLYNTTGEKEISLCLVHGVLHLLGYDDCDKKNRRLMEEEQEAILKKLQEDG